VLDHGGEVIGVMPGFIQWRERIHPRLTQFIEVKSMAERKQIMTDLSDAAIILPGGFGTMDKLFEYATGTQLKLHPEDRFKPCGLLNVNGYYTDLAKFLDQAMIAGFVQPANRKIIACHQQPAALLRKLERLAGR
jgi:uncharacterized protein (TIGR00730 family)